MGGGGALTPTTTSTPSSPSSSSEPLPPEFAEYVAVSSVSDDGESDQCCVCDDDEEVDVIPCSNRQLRERNEETDRLLRERNEETDRLLRERNKESDRLFFSKKSDRLLHGWDDIDHLLGERKEESDRLQREKDDKFERLRREGDEKFARLRREDNEEYDRLLREGDAGKEKFDRLRHEGNEKFNRLQREQSEKFYRLLYEENEEFDSLLREGNEESDSQLLEAKEESSDQGCIWDRYFNRQLTEVKELIRRYKPGDWVEGVGGAKAGHFVLPEITTLLLVGPRGSGKSTLVNRITRVFDKDNDPSAPDRAQVSRNSRSNGTVFLREYPIPRNSSAICIYDTRGWSNDPEKNFKMLHQWMTKGISNGEATMWDNDEGNKTVDIKPLGRQYSFLRYITRKVNFVIFVVDGVAVLESIDSNNKGYTEILHQTFMYPFLSIGDDKPVVVVTHGDRLSMQQRAHVQNELAELLNIPAQQIYDIPGSDDYQTDMAVLDMLHYCVRHAEQNLPVKLTYHLEVFGRETLNKMAEQLMGLDAVIEVAIIFLCIVILLLRFFR